MNEVKVYALSLAGELQGSVLPYLRHLSMERQRVIQSYRFEADKNRSVWAQLLAHYQLSKLMSVGWSEIRIERTAQGKPYVRGREWKISLSHSGDWVVCSIGETENGVDVEIETADYEEISKYCFTTKEIKEIKERGERAFLEYWTIKESYVKYRGGGIELKEIDGAAILEGRSSIAGRNFLLPDSAVIGVCTKRDYLPAKVEFVSSAQIKEFLSHQGSPLMKSPSE